MPFRPAMVFVNDSQRDRALAAAFQPNALQRVLAGDEAEVLFKGIPGRVFKAKVRLAIDAIAGGQLQTTGTIREVGATLPEDRAPALLDIVDDMSGYQVPLGSSGEAAIYAHHFARAVFVAEILLRVRSWQNYHFERRSVYDQNLGLHFSENALMPSLISSPPFAVPT